MKFKMLSGDFMNDRYRIGRNRYGRSTIYIPGFFGDTVVEVFNKDNIKSYECLCQTKNYDEHGKEHPVYTVSIIFRDGKRCLVDMEEGSYKELIVMMY